MATKKAKKAVVKAVEQEQAVVVEQEEDVLAKEWEAEMARREAARAEAKKAADEALAKAVEEAKAKAKKSSRAVTAETDKFGFKVGSVKATIMAKFEAGMTMAEVTKEMCQHPPFTSASDALLIIKKAGWVVTKGSDKKYSFTAPVVEVVEKVA